MAPRISLIVAASDNDVIGRDNALPWHQPDDLKRFKALTMGKPMLMGRKTFDSIGKALPGRISLVLTRSKDWHRDGVITVHSLEDAIAHTAHADELTVIGGAEIYRLALPRAHRIYLTRVHAVVEGDAKLPSIPSTKWKEAERLSHPADDRHAFAMTFMTLDRVTAIP